MNDLVLNRLRDAPRACQAIEHFLDKRSLEEYKSDYGLRLQIERLLDIVGEALNRANTEDERIRDAVPELSAIVGMRNRLIHGYDRIDDELIWLTASEQVPLLRQQLEAVLGEQAGTSPNS